MTQCEKCGRYITNPHAKIIDCDQEGGHVLELNDEAEAWLKEHTFGYRTYEKRT